MHVITTWLLMEVGIGVPLRTRLVLNESYLRLIHTLRFASSFKYINLDKFRNYTDLNCFNTF